MADLINLRRARKDRDRKAKADRAAENRVSFGRTAAERKRQLSESDGRQRLLDGKRLNDRDADRTDG